MLIMPLLTKFIARIWECGDIAKKKLKKKLKVIRNTSSQTIRVLNKLTDVLLTMSILTC